MTRKKKMVRTDMQTYLDIFRLKFEAKLSDRQISQALNIGRATISDLVIRFNNLGLSWPLAADYPLDSLDKQLFPGRDYSTQRVLPSWVQVHLELRRKGVTKLLLWQEYQAEHGSKALGYTQYCEHYRRWCAVQKRSMRQHHGVWGAMEPKTNVRVYHRRSVPSSHAFASTLQLHKSASRFISDRS